MKALQNCVKVIQKNMNNIISINTGGFEKAFHDYHIYLPKLKEMGFDAVDVGLCDDWNKQSLKFATNDYIKWANEYRAFCEKNELKVNQTHALFPLDKFDFDFIVKELEKEIEATSILGAKFIVIHPGLFSIKEEGKQLNFEKNVKIFKAIEPTLRKYNVIACLETLWEYDEKHIIRKTNLSFPSELIELIDALGRDNFAICLDTGHVSLFNYPVEKAILEFNDLIKVVHINDNYGTSDDHVPPMFGKLNWNDLMHSFKEINYSGAFNLELSIFNTVGKYNPELVFDYGKLIYKISKTLLEKEK